MDTTEPARAMSLRDALGVWLDLDEAEKAVLAYKVKPVFNYQGQAIENYHVIDFSVERPTIGDNAAP